MSLQNADPFVMDFFPGRDVEVRQVDEQVSSDAGLIFFRQLDQKLNLTESFAANIGDARSKPSHTLLSVIRQRVFGIIAGYEDQNDHDTLRYDPVFKLLADRSPDGEDLASQPTISRIENMVTATDLLRLENWFLDQFVESFDTRPTRITLDIDTYDDPAHGQQQLVLFNNFYKQHQYQVRLITCAENEQIALPVLLFGSAHVGIGAIDDLLRVIAKLRLKFPDIEIHVRADSGFASPKMYCGLESVPGVTYSIGYQMNVRMQAECDDLFEETKLMYEQTGVDQKDFMHANYQSKNWKRSRDLVFKCEAGAEGTNRRVVVTNRPGAAHYPDGTYQEYVDRGESENRNKELKLDLFGGRLSDHRYMANLFRLMMHSVSHNLLVRMRSVSALPGVTAESCSETPSGEISENSPAVNVTPPADLPFEARSETAKRRARNRRRSRDPLGRGQAMTWRMRVIKVAARVEVRARCIRLLIPSNWPHFGHLLRVQSQVQAFCPTG